MAVAGGGLAILSGSGVAQSAGSITSGDVAIDNDDGVVTRVTADPGFTVNWRNLDDGVAKVFVLVEARVRDGSGTVISDTYAGTGSTAATAGGWWPIYRATPWLTDVTPDMKPGTTGFLHVSRLTDVIEADQRFIDEHGAGAEASPVVILDRDGRPDYPSFNWGNVPGASLGSYLDGVSVDSATWYSNVDESGSEVNVTNTSHVPQNNYPSVDSGYYGAAANASLADVGVDGDSKTTTVDLRYTFELERANVGYWDAASDAAKATFRDGDVVAGNSPIVMAGEDGQFDFAAAGIELTGIPYDDLHANAANHVGIIVAETSFDVAVSNLAAATDTPTGNSNTGGS